MAAAQTARMPFDAAPAPFALVIDDAPGARRRTSRALAARGFRVVACENAEDALQAVAARGAPALACVDVTLPRQSGFSLCAALRARAPGLPILVTGARDGHELDDLTRALELDVELVEAREVAPRAAALCGLHEAPRASWLRQVVLGV